MEQERLYFDKTIKKTEFLFRYAGINIRSGERKISDKFKSRIVYIINFFWQLFDLSGAIYWFIDGVKAGKDFLSLTYIAPCISLGTLSYIKSVFMIINEKHVHKLIDNLKNLEIKEKMRRQSIKKNKIIAIETQFLNFVINTINTLYAVMLTTFALSPMLILAVKYYQTKETELTLPFLVMYPFDPYQIKVWPFMYLHQLWSECVTSLYICSADYFFFTCCTYIRVQFRLLQHDLETIIPVQRIPNSTLVDRDDFKNNIKELINWHQDLIESVNILEIIYSRSTLLNFLTSSLIICLTGFNVTMVKDITFMATFISFLFMSLMQVFFLCFFADLLMTSSTNVNNAIYNSQWYTTEIKNRNKLLIIQTRSQIPCKLTASGFADVSLNSFMRVLSTAWSYFALLQTIYSN